MAKKELTKIKLQIPAGKATPAPPVGPALGQHGLDIQNFCNQFNDATKDRMGDVVPTIITVYEDRSFDFVTKTPPASVELKKRAGINKGSQTPGTGTCGKISWADVEEVAKMKMVDFIHDRSLEGV